VESGNVAIAIPGDPELARAILARGRRIARTFGLDWIAVRIVRMQSSPDRDEPAADLPGLVSALGGRLLCAQGRDVACALIELSRHEHARVLVIGRSRRPRLLRRLRRGTTERILQARRPFDVVVAAEGADR
jgi:K+-sensing histidine kinase KdpD